MHESEYYSLLYMVIMILIKPELKGALDSHF